MIRYFILITSLLLTGFNRIEAQPFRPGTSGEIYGEIAALNQLTRVLYVAAHPDDENTRLLAWLEGKMHVPTTYLSLTRGDGGQNILGSEQGAALGLIRTQELLAARAIDGAQQAFTRAIDFGYSKSADETLQNWDSLQILHDMVWVIRKLKPDLIICRFPPTAEAGHGHHAASAILARRAYHMAADPKAFPNQPFEAWKAHRLLFNGFKFGNRNTTREDDFQLEIGDFLPLKGMGSGEIAGASRSIHRSQGAGTPSTAGKQTEYFRVLEGPDLHHDLWEGINRDWSRAQAPGITARIEEILKHFDYQNPSASLPKLLALRKKINREAQGYWKQEKLKDLDRVILRAAGLMAVAHLSVPEVQAGDNIELQLDLVSRSRPALVLESIEWMGKATPIQQTLVPDSLVKQEIQLSIPADMEPSQPYWLREPAQDPYHFTIPEDRLIGLPESPSSLLMQLQFSIEGEKIVLALPLSYKVLDPIWGDKIEPLRLTPDYSLKFRQDLLWFSPQEPMTTEIVISAHKALTQGQLILEAEGKMIEKSPAFGLAKGQDTLFRLTLSDRWRKTISEAGAIRAYLEVDGRRYPLSQHRIRYDHIPTQQYFTPAKQRWIPVTWKSAARRIAYIPGAGDQCADILTNAGLIVDYLSADQIHLEALKPYDAVLTGVRMLNTEPASGLWMSELLKYVEQGGTLVMQYNTHRPLHSQKIGPYPFRISRDRVTEESAAVIRLEPEHPLLQFPNRISEEDFEGWVQERGLYFAEGWDERYQTLFRMSDQGESPLDGSLIYTPFGKGQYIYTGLSFFRQLPAGQAGAMKLLVNLLSAGKNPGLHEQKGK